MTLLIIWLCCIPVAYVLFRISYWGENWTWFHRLFHMILAVGGPFSVFVGVVAIAVEFDWFDKPVKW